MHFSIVKNYALDKTSFLYPKIDNFLNEEYGQYSIQEFPILNYISSFFFKKYPYFLKLINIILLYIGSCFLVFWAKQYLDDYFGAIVVATNFLTIPIVFYYGWSYITDISALSFGIISVYLLELNKHNEKQYLLILSFISLTLCGLLRLPVLILPIAYHITELLYRFSLNKLFCLLISFTIIGLWYTHFLVSNQYYVQLPKEISIFAANKDEMSIVLKEWDRLMKYQLGYIQSSSLYYLIIIVLAIIYKHIFTKEFITKVALVALFSITYLILWFKVFNEHDYYMIPIVPSVIISIIILAKLLREIDTKIYYAIMLILTSYNLIYSIENIRWRWGKPIGNSGILMSDYEVGMHWWFANEDRIKWALIRKISPFVGSKVLEKSGIKIGDTAICNFDASPTYVLSILGLQGWSLYNNCGNIQCYIDKAKKGAKYLISYGGKLNDNDTIKAEIITRNVVMRYDSIIIYDIKHITALDN